MRFPWCAFALMAPLACTTQRIADPSQPVTLERFEILTGGAQTEDRLPIIVALHGLGDRPASFVHVFEGWSVPARVIIPRAPAPDGLGGFRWFSARTREGNVDVISRQIARASEPVDRLLVELFEQHGVRPVITGFSQGGMLSYAVAAIHPEHVLAAVPISGWLPPPLWPEERPARPPLIRALHGTADPIVPVGLDRQGCAHLVAVGFDATLQTFQGVAHTVTPDMHALWMQRLNEATGGRRVPAGTSGQPFSEP